MNDPREANLGGRALLKRLFHALPFKAPISFLHSYVFRLGFLDGKAGFDYAVARAMYYWQIRIKTENPQGPTGLRRGSTTRWWRSGEMIPARRFHAGPAREADVADATDAAHVWPRVGDPPGALQRLDLFTLAPGQRGRSALTVQLWWLVQGSLFRWSPQFAYGFRRWLLRLFGARVGAKALIRPSATVTYPWKVDIGEHAWIGDDAVIYSLGPVHIGAHAVVSQRSYLCAADHDPDQPDFPLRERAVRIEDGAWVATDVFVAPA